MRKNHVQLEIENDLRKYEDNENILKQKELQLESARDLYNDTLYKDYIKESSYTNKQKLLGDKKYNIKKELVESVLYSIFESVMQSVLDGKDIDPLYNRSLVTNYLKDIESDTTVGLQSIFGNTQLLSELSLLIEDTYDNTVEKLDIDNPETIAIDNEPAEEILDTIKGTEEVEDIVDSIKIKVTNALDEFIDNNIEEKETVKDILNTAEDKIKDIKTFDSEEREEIAAEYTLIAKQKVKDYQRNKPRSLFEHMVFTTTESILTNPDIKHSFYNESGLDMDNIVNKVTAQYAFLEMLNTLNIDNKIISKLENTF